MTQISAEDVALAEKLGVDLRVGALPLAVMQLVRLVADLQKRIAEMEAKRGRR